MTTAVEYFEKNAGVRKLLSKTKDVLTGKNIAKAENVGNRRIDTMIRRVKKIEPNGRTARGSKALDDTWVRADKRVSGERLKTRNARISTAAGGAIVAGAGGATAYQAKKD